MNKFAYSIIAIGLLFVVFFTYSNSLHNDFLMDDFPTLIENSTIETTSFLHLNPANLKKYAYFRPVTHLLNLLTFKNFGLEPFYYHITNLILLLFSSLFIYQMIYLIFFRRSLALLTALFFYIHPINGVLVNYKNATGFGMLTFSMSLSFMLFLMKDNSSKEKSTSISSSFFHIIALLCHELVVAYPLYLGGILFFGKNYSLRKTFSKCIPSILITLGYLAFRSSVTSMNTRIIDNIHSLNINVTSYIGSYLNLILWYLKKLVFLDGIVLFWETPIIQTHLILWILLFCFILLGSFYIFSRKKTNSIIRFSLSWMIIGLLPVLAGCVSRIEFGMIIEPHWLFFSSIGFFTLLSFIFLRIKSAFNNIIFYVLLTIFCVFYITSTRHYNFLWGNQIRYCQYWTSILPKNTFPNHWLALSYMKEDNYPKAKKYYKVLAKKNVKRAEVYGCLGIIAFDEKKYTQALEYFLKSLEINPKSATTHYNLGLTYLKLKNTIQAKKHLTKTLEIDSTIAEAQELLNSID